MLKKPHTLRPEVFFFLQMCICLDKRSSASLESTSQPLLIKQCTFCWRIPHLLAFPPNPFILVYVPTSTSRCPAWVSPRWSCCLGRTLTASSSPAAPWGGPVGSGTSTPSWSWLWLSGSAMRQWQMGKKKSLFSWLCDNLRRVGGLHFTVKQTSK